MSVALEPARKNASLVKTATSLLSERQRMPSLAKTNSTLTGLVKNRTDHGKKLLALGTALLIAPDPITDAAAVPVLIAGKLMQRRHSSNLKNVYEEMHQTLSSLSSLSL